MMKFLRRLFAGAPAPESNAASLGGRSNSHRGEVRDGLRLRGLHIENDGPPLPGVTRLSGGLGGLFDGEVNNLGPRRQIPNNTDFLKDGAHYED